MNECLICGCEIVYSGRGRPRKFCEECMSFIPNSVFNPKYYEWFKFLLTLSKEELKVLFGKYKRECKYVKDDEILECRTRLKIINDVYNLFLYNNIIEVKKLD